MENIEQSQPRKPKHRLILPLSDLKPGSVAAIRKGCRCSTVFGLPSPSCPLHRRDLIQQRTHG